MQRVTAACPAALVADANHLAMVLGLGPADGQSYRIGSWRDADGYAYACVSFLARPEWLAAAQSGLVRPAWDTDQIIDMAAADRAQAALDLTPGVQAGQGRIAVVIGGTGREALEAMGVS
jgi:hypothetical protein